ncbi:MAG: sucrose phosphorylase [Chloroflexota bacterium]|nr:sucrose phosphorylase [Chloroflexota bacterium]
MTIKNKVQLITYPDSMGGNLPALNQLLSKHFKVVFQGGIHILPPFPSSADRGFAPTTYFEIDPAFGTWEDIRAIGEHFDVMLDLMVNHISRQSTCFQDFVRKGRSSKYADMFITLDKVWSGGDPPPEDIANIFLRKPEHPFSDIIIESTGETERIWTSFGPRVDYAEQIDLDVNSPVTKDFLIDILTHFSQQNIKFVRLDAVAYAIKKPGTTCFMVEPEVYAFIDWLAEQAAGVGLELLPEVHDHLTTQIKLAEHGYWVYDFVLPMLILYTLFNTTSTKLRNYLRICPRNQFTMLDCHDGIPVQPDMDDILTMGESKKVVDVCLERGANLNTILSANKIIDGFDAHQINCTYYSALDSDDDAYIAARAIQFFAPGVPQVYYVGLLAGENDYKGVERSGEGRAINRCNYSVDEVEQALAKDVVQQLLKLIRFRNNHPAFDGRLDIPASYEGELLLTWVNEDQWCRLNVDLHTCKTLIKYTDQNGNVKSCDI